MFEYIPDIKEHYENITPRIMSNDKRLWTNPYVYYIKWEKIFSPIEDMTWMALRSFGQTPLYPQYPVDKYFVDFGNPKVKVAIECDGKEWHLDKEKDAKRDNILLKKGWHIYRIGGAACFKICDNNYYDRHEFDEREQYDILQEYYTIIEGLLKSIAFFYFDFKDYSLFEMEMDIAFKCLRNHVSPIQHEIVVDELNSKMIQLKNDYYNFKENLLFNLNYLKTI